MQLGLDHFYGFIAGETDPFYPAIYRGTTPVEPPETPEQGYQLTRDLAERLHRVGAPAEDHRARPAGVFDAGVDKMSPVSNTNPKSRPGFRFTGRIEHVTFDFEHLSLD